MFNHNYYVYILTNAYNRVLYTGVTNDLERRVHEHKTFAKPKSFTARYNVTKLVYFEYYNDITEAISREKAIKRKSRSQKFELINKFNPSWKDLVLCKINKFTF